MNDVTIHIDGKPNPRLEYTLAVLNEHPIVKKGEFHFSLAKKGIINITYGKSDFISSLYIPKQELVFNDTQENYISNQYSIGTEILHSVEVSAKEVVDFYENEKFGFDIFETIFFHLSRYEEVYIDFKKYLKNKLEYESKLLSVRCGIEKIPVVDEVISAFLQIISGQEVAYPKPQVLSHDIDFIKKFQSPFSIIRKIAGQIRHRKSLKGFSYLWKSYFDYVAHGQDGFDTFDWMISEQKIDKTIYFLVGGNHKEDNEYDLKSKVVVKALKLAKERNYNIGIHPSYDSWEDENLIRTQKENLEHEVGVEISSSRQHFLNFDITKTPKLLQNLGIREDSSLGYTRYVGYRCGTGFSYKLYDFENEKAFDVIEKPLVFMDVAWLYEAIRNNDFSLPELSKFYGSFNFHNSTFDEMEVRGIKMKEHYLKIFG